jgi:hypothetical protein
MFLYHTIFEVSKFFDAAVFLSETRGPDADPPRSTNHTVLYLQHLSESCLLPRRRELKSRD